MTKLAEYIPFVLYVVMIAGFFAYVIRRKLNPEKNLFVTGEPVRLNKRIELEVLLSREEFIETNVQVTAKSRQLWIVIYVFIFIAVMTAALGSALDKNNQQVSWLMFIAPVAIFVVLVVLVPGYFQKRNFGKLYDSSPIVKDPIKYMLDAERGELQSPVANTDFSWEMVSDVIETRDYVLIYIGPASALFLAKNKFAQGDLAILLGFLNANFRVRKR
ncbi:MAG TPA: YcxB family protein [Chitinophagales bacterium]|nr:YcxB family protein [Chitinophagales bacterium]